MSSLEDHSPEGTPITMTAEGTLQVPDDPIVPFIEGDGIGPDLWRAASSVLDAAVARAYRKSRTLRWHEVFAGEKAFERTGTWLPDETVRTLRHCLVGMKGPLTTPVARGIRSLNVALRRRLDLYCGLRPVRWIPGTPSPLREPDAIDVVLFRENTEDVHTGIEWPAGSEETRRVVRFLQDQMGVRTIRFPDTSAIGVKPMSRQGTRRLVRAAVHHALSEGRKSLTLIHAGNVMKFTEGAFRQWGYELLASEFRELTITARERLVLAQVEQNPELDVESLARHLEPAYDRAPAETRAALREEVEASLELRETFGNTDAEELLLVKDTLANALLHQVLARPDEFDVLACSHLNGDFLSRALAACVGGIGMAPAASLNYVTGHALFETAHGSAPKHAGQDTANPSSLIAAGQMMLVHLGWNEAAELVDEGLRGAIAAKTVTADLARTLKGATAVGCAEFGQAIIKHMAE